MFGWRGVIKKRIDAIFGRARGHGGSFGRSTSPIFLCPPTSKLCCAQKNLFWTYNKNKNISSLKRIFPPPSITWLRACLRELTFCWNCCSVDIYNYQPVAWWLVCLYRCWWSGVHVKAGPNQDLVNWCCCTLLAWSGVKRSYGDNLLFLLLSIALYFCLYDFCNRWLCTQPSSKKSQQNAKS